MKHAFDILIETKNHKPLGVEEVMMAGLAIERGVQIHSASLSELQRDRFKVRKNMVAVGSVPFVKQALRQLSLTLPPHNPYPASLAPYLHRRVRRLPTLRSALDLIEVQGPQFVRPADDWKRFTGFVAESPDDPRFNGSSRAKPVWIADVVRFKSEWRVYVGEEGPLGIHFADHGGDRTIVPDEAVIFEAIDAFRDSGLAPKAYVIDFGVLDTGETALVEVNDGFSFGAYDYVSAEVIWDVIVPRWFQITRFDPIGAHVREFFLQNPIHAINLDSI